MDEYLLKAKLEDAIRLSYKTIKFIGFLDPSESAYLKSLLKYENEVDYQFFGGFGEAERLILAVSRNEINEEDFPLEAITLKFREEDELSHRDFLGSFMAQGVQRLAVGDILVESGRAVVFVKSELVSYFKNSIAKIGKVGVKCKEGFDLPLPQAHQFKDMSGVIASQRADCVISFLMKNSRDKASTAIKAGIVQCNYAPVTSVSQKIKEGDKISIRGTGKFLINELSDLTKKERLIIKCKKYI